MATVPTEPLAWELPYAVDAALKRWKKKKECSVKTEEKVKDNKE